jgi:preprotein translocase subunit SecG
MYQLIIIVHVLLGLGVVGLILMQQGKGADAGAAFSGGGGASSVFGAQGASSFLSRTTAILAALFFTTSLGLAVLSGYENKPEDLMDKPAIVEPLEDVPLIGDRPPPSEESIPVIAPTEAISLINEENTETNVINTIVDETMTLEGIVKPQLIPVVNDAKDKVSEVPVVDSATPVSQP